MLDNATLLVIGSAIAGLAGGFLSAWTSFNSSGEKFDGRKFGNGLITGGLAGIGLGILAAVAAPKDMTQAASAVLLFVIFLGSAGGDRLRSSASKMTAARVKPAATTTTTTTTASPPG